MNQVVEWLLGLERIRLDAGGPLSIRLATPPAAWGFLAGLVLVAAMVVLAYRMESVRGWTRLLLAGCRMAVILLVMALLARPVLVLSRNRVDPSVVAVLLDQSASMEVSDSPLSGPPSPPRWQSAIDGLTGPSGLLARLAERHQVDVWLFSATAKRAASLTRPGDVPAVARLLRETHPDGARTDLPAALAGVLDQTRGSRLAGVVVVSDGRQSSPQRRDVAIGAVRDDRVAVHAVAVGSSEPRRDVVVRAVRAPTDVFLKDLTPVHVRLSAEGYTARVPVTLELRDEATQTLLALERCEIDPAQPATEAEVRFRPARPGPRTLRLTALPRDDETDPANNAGDTVVRVHDEKIRVLYVESVPRFEYRYLKNTILREPTLESSMLLLSAARGFPQEGTHPIRAFPTSAEELNAYHVILLGDVDPRGDWISPAQLRLLVDFVSVRGGGVGFIAGETAMPLRLHQTPLERLVPVRVAPASAGRYEQPLTTPFTPQLTAEGRRHPLLRLDVERDRGPFGADRSSDALAQLPGWFWAASVAAPAPGAEVLATHPTLTTPDGPIPLLVLGRYGAGRTFYQGTDDTWRWRRQQGEGYFDAYWLNVIRLLARGARLGPERRWRFETERRENPLGEPVRLRLASADPASAGATDSVTVQIVDGRGHPLDSLTLDRLGPASQVFEGAFWPRSADRYEATARVPVDAIGAEPPMVTFQVTAADPERREASTDHDFLRLMAVRSGGRFVAVDSAASLADAIPDVSVLVPDDITEPLWDTRLALLLFVVPITLEWVVRTVRGMA